MNGILTRKIKKFSFVEQSFSKNADAFEFSNGIVFRFNFKKLPSANARKILFNLKGFELSFIRKNATDKESFTPTQQADRVWLYADEDGFVSLLEMKVNFLSPYADKPKEMICDLPLKLFNPTINNVYFVYDGASLSWIYNGEKVNVDYPFGAIIDDKKFSADAALYQWSVAPLSAMTVQTENVIENTNMAFYSPRGYNCWAGDVVNFYKNGVYHLLYLHDVHHHNSRWGGGAHTMHHLTTKDFLHWEDHGEMIPLNQSWKSVGTGTMFFHKGQYYYAHGFHTDRVIPTEKTGSALLRDRNEENKICGIAHPDLENLNLFPSGANFFISNDGIHFQDGEYQFHVAENPSIYATANDTLTMYAGYGSNGVWTANDVKGPWIRQGDFQLDASPVRPSTECPSRFSLNDYTYLLIGGTGYWKTDKNGTQLKDEAKEGYDVYDGLFVPMVTKTEDNRLIYAGWSFGYGWGSLITHRELIQGENGRLYMRWLPELAPKADELEEVYNFSMEERCSYYFEAYITPNQDGKVCFRFVGNKDCAIVLDSQKETVQISEVAKNEQYPPYIQPLYIRANSKDGVPHQPTIYGDFTLGRVETIKNEYKIRVIAYYEKKFDSVVIDAEIGEKRTLFSNRVETNFSSLSWTTENATVSKATLYKIKPIL